MNRLLVADDEPKIREVIREYAEFNDYEVTEAEDGMEAVQLCKDNDYDIIIRRGRTQDKVCPAFQS